MTTTADDPMAQAIQPLVDASRLAGAATLVWRSGETRTLCLGWRDIDARLPIERDTLFRIASLTKPITSAAALMMADEGRFALGDPIARWAPEFARMRVLRSPAAPLDDTALRDTALRDTALRDTALRDTALRDTALSDTVPAGRPITFEDLLTHRSGLTYGAFWPGPLADAYREALGRDIDSHLTPEEWMARLAALPLIDQPGATMHYGHSTDLLGFLLARIDGTPLAELLARRIFGPLGMTDTGFTVPPEKRMRRAATHGFDDGGRLVRLDAPRGGAFLPERPDDITFAGGGAGLWSTLDDYLAFARMFIGHGMVDGVRLLRPETLSLMTTNCLTADQRATAEVARMPLFMAGHGFGMGVAVVTEPEHAEPVICGGSAGAVGWPGAFGSWWRADPGDDSVRIFMTHNMVDGEQFARGIGFGVYEAITKFQALSG